MEPKHKIGDMVLTTGYLHDDRINPEPQSLRGEIIGFHLTDGVLNYEVRVRLKFIGDDGKASKEADAVVKLPEEYWH